MNSHIFALDIGTRSVTGMLLEKDETEYTIKKHYVLEHKERSMLDGQIHNVVQVANVIQQVKDALQSDEAVPLTDVYVAAAGRSLKTIRATAEAKIIESPFTTAEMVKHLELSAVHQAQVKLIEENPNETIQHYYCVGYSVMRYYLDGEPIGSLIDQQGEIASTEVIATFLPTIVVDSLHAALERAGLHMKALTLEPIAALQVLIPESMRRLNIALVDIGAGTSDIALTRDGTVTAYGMVPVAGDEITEALSDAYLLDYREAEQMKRAIHPETATTITDILGFETDVSYSEFTHVIDAAVSHLGETIAEEILTLNQQPPKAVMLIGGGSLTPYITDKIADQLKLPKNRVAIRDVEAIEHLNKTDRLPSGPDFVTPIGIAISAEEQPIHSVTVRINNQPLRIFETKKMTVGDCCIEAGIDIRKLYGKPGLSKFITVNGEDMILPGTLGTPPEISLNNVLAHVDDIVSDGDAIEITKGTDGLSAHFQITDIVEMPQQSITVTCQNKAYTLAPQYMVNGVEVQANHVLEDKDYVVTKQIKTIDDFLSMMNEEQKTSKAFTIYINGLEVTLPNTGASILINGRPSEQKQLLHHDDVIEITYNDKPTVADAFFTKYPRYWDITNVFFHDKPIDIQQQKYDIIRNDEILSLDSTLHMNDELYIKERKRQSAIFQDIFRYIELDLTEANGRFTLLKNAEPTSFDSHITSGDILEIKWETS